MFAKIIKKIDRMFIYNNYYFTDIQIKYLKVFILPTK